MVTKKEKHSFPGEGSSSSLLNQEDVGREISQEGSVAVSAEIEDTEYLTKVLAEEKAKAERFLANWQRAQADFINYKKRAEQEQTETARMANSMLVSNLLPVLDDLERAFGSVPPKLVALTWVDGIRLIYRKLRTVLDSQGLTEIRALGEPFNPLVHEAVTYAEGEEGKVIEELQKGYKFQDRVIRPAMVVVGKGKKEEKPEAQT